MTKAKANKANKGNKGATIDQNAQQALDSVVTVSAHDALIAALETRRLYAVEQCEKGEKQQGQVDIFAREKKAFTPAMVEMLQTSGVDVSALSARIAQTVKRDDSFVAVYALEKVRKICDALMLNSARNIDGYSNAILKQIFLALNREKITNKTALVTLSPAIEYTESDQIQAIKVNFKYSCAPSTASTQSSSTRKALQVLQCAAYERADKALVMLNCPMTDKLSGLYQ